jgi:hypothetical protein
VSIFAAARINDRRSLDETNPMDRPRPILIGYAVANLTPEMLVKHTL